MNCTEAREAMLVAEPAEFRAEGGSELAAHVGECEVCRSLATRIGGRSRSTVVADSSPIETPHADARRSADCGRGRRDGHGHDEARRSADGRRTAAHGPAGERRVHRSRRRTAGDGDQDGRSKNHAGLDFLREQLMRFARLVNRDPSDAGEHARDGAAAVGHRSQGPGVRSASGRFHREDGHPSPPVVGRQRSSSSRRTRSRPVGGCSRCPTSWRSRFVKCRGSTPT